MMTQRVLDPAGALLQLDAAADASVCGQKAATLAALRAAGFPVPDGFVVAAGAHASVDLLASPLEQLGPGPWAVRSSGLAEDLDAASFAGQYESVLGVTTVEGTVDAIDHVRASGRAAHVAAYRDARGIAGDGGVAVLIQRQVQARAAGVAFSANPLTGDDEVVIEAVSGLGDRRASGEADADRWVVDEAVRAVVDTGVLDAEQVQAVAALARRIAAARGRPQDIEWAFDGANLVVLQARPITGLPQPPVIEIPPGRWLKDEIHWAGPMTPIGVSIVLPVLESGLGTMLDEFGLPLERMAARSFGGEVYTQEIEIGGKHNPGAAPPWWLGAIAFRVVPPLRRVAAKAAQAIAKLEAYPRAWEESWRDECAGRIDAARTVNLTALDDRALLAHFAHVLDGVLAPNVLVHCRLIMPDIVALHELAECCREALGWDDARTLALVAGLSITATQPAIELAEIARLAGADAVAQGLDAVRATAAGPRLDAWLARWGMRSLEMDPGSPTIAEQEGLVLGLLRQPPPGPSIARFREHARAEARAAITEPSRRARFEAALQVAERVHPQREDNVLYTQSLPIGLVRGVLLEIGRRLVAAGVLSAAEGVMYLERTEIAEALEGVLSGEPAAARVRRRQAERRWVRAHPGPSYHGPAPVAPPSPRGLPRALQRLVAALLWDLKLEAAPPASSSPDDGALSGAAASAGRATGRVRVVRSEEELARFESGEVLVCRSTHSSWAVVFARAAAVVTDHGGILSHPALVAREYGIPAVVGTGSATARLRDGQVVSVDGSIGRVEILTGRPPNSLPY
jgi:pyruvate,water dikinase